MLYFVLIMERSKWVLKIVRCCVCVWDTGSVLWVCLITLLINWDDFIFCVDYGMKWMGVKNCEMLCVCVCVWDTGSVLWMCLITLLINWDDFIFCVDYGMKWMGVKIVRCCVCVRHTAHTVAARHSHLALRLPAAKQK